MAHLLPSVDRDEKSSNFAPNHSDTKLYIPSEKSSFSDDYIVDDTRSTSKRRKLLVVGAIVAVAAVSLLILGGSVFEHPALGDHTGGVASSPTPGLVLEDGDADMVATNNLVARASLSCGTDPYRFSNPSSLSVRKEHPLLIAAGYKWDCLKRITPQDRYLSSWNSTIFRNAQNFYNMPPTQYVIDGGLGGSGVLDVAREVQLRIKHWAYAYRMTKDVKWAKRTYQEIQVAAGNSSQFFGAQGNNWNTAHFLDVGEFTAAFAIAYDWLYDAWTQQQRTAIMWSIINLGLKKGISAYGDGSAWWSSSAVQGNWNCVCNGGLILGALAIRNEDPTGTAAKMLSLAVPNIRGSCSFAPTDEGAWQETANYWYFGTTGHVQAAAALISATGSDQGLLSSNPGMKMSGFYHMHTTANVGLFDYGDTGPRKFTATANGMMWYGSQYNIDAYTLFQRDQADAAEPMSMLYYQPQIAGAFWNNLPIDHYYSNPKVSFASMRSSWTDQKGLYVAMRASLSTGHQSHCDLDAGTFVVNALGQDFFGELGNGQYLSAGYFKGEGQDSPRWTYYQKASEGQNVLLVNRANQLVTGQPRNKFGSTGEVQTSARYTPPRSSTAFMTTDLTSFYEDTSSYKRGIRLLDGRRQILIQDEITTSGAILWRAHTNASVALAGNGRSATLRLGGQTMIATILSPSGAVFSKGNAVRLTGADSPTLKPNTVDYPVRGVTVLSIALGSGTRNIQISLRPQWADFNSFTTPRSVALDKWSLTSH